MGWLCLHPALLKTEKLTNNMNYYYSMHEEIAAIQFSLTRWIIDLTKAITDPNRVIKIG